MRVPGLQPLRRSPQSAYGSGKQGNCRGRRTFCSSTARGSGWMKFSIVIATYNRASVLRDTLASLAQLRPAEPWEVIVVDNNSPDDTRQIVEAAAPTFPSRLVYAFEREQGRSAALNRGFGLATGDIVVTTDDDVRVDPDWL